MTKRQELVRYIARQLGVASRVELTEDVVRTAVLGTYANRTAAAGFDYVTASDRQVASLFRAILGTARAYRASALRMEGR